jgi:signal transduction histidine kinase
VRRLSQQLFELAALQPTDQVLHHECFNLDDRMRDAVQKFEPGQPAPKVALAGALQGIERALSNLIDKAQRLPPGAAPVRMGLQRDGACAQIRVEDTGPGLPAEVLARLDGQRCLRDPPLKHPGGGIGGLGLAIAQRMALLDGGSLLPLPALLGGRRRCLGLPLAEPGLT